MNMDLSTEEKIHDFRFCTVVSNIKSFVETVSVDLITGQDLTVLQRGIGSYSHS